MPQEEIIWTKKDFEDDDLEMSTTAHAMEDPLWLDSTSRILLENFSSTARLEL